MLLDGAIQLQPEQNGQAQEALTVKDSGHTDVVEAEADTDDAADKLVHINVLTPLGRVIQLGAMPASDVLSSVKQTLLELGETCSFTAYHLSYAGEGDTQEIILNDYVEMLAYPFLEGNVTLKMVLEPYDVKKARFHVRRFKDLLQFPPAERLMAEEDKEVEQPDASASEEAPLPSTQSEAQSSTQLEEQPTEDAQKDLVKRWKKALDQRASLNKALRAKLPDTEIVTNASLTDYFDRTLHSLVEDSLIDIAPEPCLQHITYSAWNPPPNHRKMQGDLLYLQVQTFDDGTLHITCTRAGFYVNRTSHSTFDPQPALNCHFSHELLYTLLSASPSFLKAWSQSLEKANDVQRRVTNPLVNISAAVKWGNLAVSFIRTPWLVPVSNGNLRAHIADATRAEDDLLDTYGLDDKSVVREWCAPKKETGVRSALAVGFVQCNMSSSYIPRAKHFRRNHFTAFICVLSSLALLTISLLTSLLTRHDELQTVRDLNPRSMHEKLMKQRFIYKTYVEFTESCKTAVVAIVDGHIAPMNPQDSERAHVYIYNNIFFSRANDANDTLRMFYGDDASRKSVGKDLAHQRLIQSLGIEGLNTVMTTIVDYKGHRLTGQSLLPGILQHGRSGARLMYGALEAGANLRCKAPFHACMQELCKKLRIAERKVSTSPYNKDLLACPPCEGFEAKGVDPSRLRLMATDTQQNTTMNLDDDDEIVPDENGCVPFAGPLECKGIQGSDGRLYLLEITRVGPRDANFIPVSQGGTGVYTDEELSWIDPGMAPTFVLRHELIAIWTHNILRKFRTEVFQELNFFQNEAKDEDNPTSATTAEQTQSEYADGMPTPEGKSDSSTAKSESPADASRRDANLDKAAQVAKLEQLRTREMQFMSTHLLNVNVFTPYITSQPEEERAADEALAREVAMFLTNNVLIEITEEVRLRTLVPVDGAFISQTLHNRGVNIRYLGRLAKMARTEEGRDAELESRNLQRPYPLPKYWLEMLETEMIARVSKYVLGARLQKDEAPAAQTIAAFLNSLLGGSDGEEAPVLANGAAHGKAPAKVTQWKKGSKKAKRAGFSAMLSALTSSECPEVTVDSPVDATAWAHIVQACRSRFCYEFVLLGPSASAEHRQPLCKTAVLRRVCQQCGIHLASKNFNFLLRRPFCIRDVVNVQPLTKSSTPLVPCEDAREALESAQAEIERGNIRGAFLAAQRASSMMQQVCGAFHGDLARSLDTVANVLLQAEDTEAAIAMMYKSLAVNMQSTGLDTHHTVELHEKLGMVLHASGQTDIGLKHMHAALYIRSISCGPGHAGVLEAYQRIATMYQEIQHYSMAVKYLQHLLARSADLDKISIATVYHCLADILGTKTQFRDAIACEKEAYLLLRNICGESDPRTREAEAYLQKYTKAAVDQAQQAVKEQNQVQAQAYAEDAVPAAAPVATAPVRDNVAVVTDDENTSKGAKKKKNKRKK